MKHRLRRLLIAFAVCAGLGLGGVQLCAQRDDAATGPLVLLRNGHVLHGSLTNLGDRCLVTLTRGGEVRLPSKEVIFACETLDEAYQFLAQQIPAEAGARAHCDLAKWCLRQRLFDRAAEQLDIAAQRSGRQGEVEALRRQLEYEREAAARPVVSEEAPARPADDPAAAQAVAKVPVSPQQLERTMSELPKDAVEQFVGSVQPLLLNRCGGGRCHDAGGKSDFVLLRPTTGNQVWRRLTLRNLYNVLEHVDRGRPEESMLLKMSREPHGGTGTAVFPEESVAYAQLEQWARRAGNSSALPPTPPASMRAEPLAADAVPPQESPAADVVPASAVEENEPAFVAEAEAAQDDSSDFQPRDPFDPEIFNRRFGR